MPISWPIAGWEAGDDPKLLWRLRVKRITLLSAVTTLLALLALTACVRPAPGSVVPPTFTPVAPGQSEMLMPPAGATPTLMLAPTLDPNAIIPSAVPESPGEPAEPPAEAPAPEEPAAPDQGAASTGETVHIVQPGENLYRIGLQYGFTYQELAAYNGIANPDRLEVGQEIRIPPRP